MRNPESSFFSVAGIRNEQVKLPDDALSFMNDRIALHQRDLELKHSFLGRFRLTDEELAIKAKARSRLIDLLNMQSEAERLREIARHRKSIIGPIILPDPFDKFRTVADHFQPVAGEAEMWWARTDWFFPTSFTQIWMDGQGVHVAAKFEIDSGDLHKYWIRVVAQFVLSEDRMPPRGRDYLSNPVSEAIGPVYGYTMAHDLFDFGDYWSKCWLNVKQTLFPLGLNPAPGTFSFGIGHIASDSRQIVFIEDGPGAHVNLPGLIAMPPIRFFLPQDSPLVTVELEYEFHVQLEGEAGLWLGFSPNEQACIIRHPQWPIRPV